MRSTTYRDYHGTQAPHPSGINWPTGRFWCGDVAVVRLDSRLHPGLPVPAIDLVREQSCLLRLVSAAHVRLR